MKTMSAVSNVFASLGFGSNVCELVPSGTMPVTSVPVPPAMLATMLVIGATVVAMVSTPVTGAPCSQPMLESSLMTFWLEHPLSISKDIQRVRVFLCLMRVRIATMLEVLLQSQWLSISLKLEQ